MSTDVKNGSATSCTGILIANIIELYKGSSLWWDGGMRGGANSFCGIYILYFCVEPIYYIVKKGVCLGGLTPKI